MKIIKHKTKIYSVDWICNGFCYRTTMGCTWEDVKKYKRTAKLLGEKIEYEHYDTVMYFTSNGVSSRSMKKRFAVPKISC